MGTQRVAAVEHAQQNVRTLCNTRADDTKRRFQAQRIQRIQDWNRIIRRAIVKCQAPRFRTGARHNVGAGMNAGVAAPVTCVVDGRASGVSQGIRG